MKIGVRKTQKKLGYFSLSSRESQVAFCRLGHRVVENLPIKPSQSLPEPLHE